MSSDNKDLIIEELKVALRDSTECLSNFLEWEWARDRFDKNVDLLEKVEGGKDVQR